MSSKDRATRRGLNSKYISPHYLAIIRSMRKHRRISDVERELGVDKASISAIIRIIEGKLKTKLFDRECGRGHSEWHLRKDTAAERAWRTLLEK